MEIELRKDLSPVLSPFSLLLLSPVSHRLHMELEEAVKRSLPRRCYGEISP